MGIFCGVELTADIRGVVVDDAAVDSFVVNVTDGVDDRIKEIPLELFVGAVISPFFSDETLN